MVPIELPGRIVPLTMTLPPSAAAAEHGAAVHRVRLNDAIEPFTASVPALIVVPPV